jgi:hypothetical protein
MLEPGMRDEEQKGEKNSQTYGGRRSLKGWVVEGRWGG